LNTQAFHAELLALKKDAEYSRPTKRSIASQVGERIKGLRLQTRGGKLTQEKLAERADISVSFLSMIERGERSAHVDTLAQIAAALGVPLEDLFRLKTHAPDLGDSAMRPLADFVQRHRLTRREIERLLTVAQALFGS
jgi:transcriptional regulator with XRE-family HTH domain